jgi:signal transduction histidine kinase
MTGWRSRYRLEPRLEAAGLQLQWDVHEVPKLTWLNPTAALQMLRIVQEVLANVLKHARARTIRVATQADADQAIVLIADDGVGFDVDQVRTAGRGLENMKRRAAEIGGRIEINSGRGATVLRIVLPVHRPE